MLDTARPLAIVSRIARIGAWSWGLVVLAWLSATAGVTMQAPAIFSIDAANSRVAIEVGRSGLLGFAGHDHEVIAPAVTGRVAFDPRDWAQSSVTLQFDASALKVTGKGDPPADIPKVQTVMFSDQVLDVKRFPSVAFRSRRVSVTPHGPNSADLVIEGDLTLHGETRPATVRAATTIQPDGLTARGAFLIKQTNFGMTPVTAAGGTVRVRDDVRVEFELKARHE
jgi:polyisoprenoid-binding protein YceI